MKTQRTIIYISIFIIVGCFILYSFCVFRWFPVENTLSDRWKTFISNITIGVLASSIVSLFVAIISYNNDKRNALESYTKAQKKLFEHSSVYGNYQDKRKWFSKYLEKYEQLSDAWSKIMFFIDPKKHRMYLKEIVDFYGDFILLTQNQFRLLEYSDIHSKKNTPLKEIEEIIFSVKSYNQGLMESQTTINNITINMEMVSKNIDNIYRKRRKVLFKKYYFDKTLVTPKCFIELDDKVEKYVKQIIKEINRTNSTTIVIKCPIEIIQILFDKQYISGYSGNKGQSGTYEISCQFLLCHYFELKDRMKKYNSQS